MKKIFRYASYIIIFVILALGGNLAVGCNAKVDLASNSDVSLDENLDREASETMYNLLGAANYTPPEDSEWQNLPAQYNMREEMLLLTQDQSPYGLCWAHSMLTALETSIARAYGEYYNFAEGWIQVNYAGLNNQKKPNIGGGGDFLPERLRNNGLLLESDLPLDVFDEIDNNNYKIYYNYFKEDAFAINDDYKTYSDSKWATYYYSSVSDAQREQMRGQIKYFIKNTGALYVKVLSRTKLVDNQSIILNAGSAHAVTIIGWDDNINCAEYGTGAWAVLNSYGERSNEADEHTFDSESSTNGIYYLPYSIANYNNMYGFVIDKSNSTSANVELVSGNTYEVKKYNKNTAWSAKENVEVIQKNVFAYNPAGTQIDLQYKCVNVDASQITSITIWDGTMDITDKFNVIKNTSTGLFTITTKSDTVLDWGTYKIEVKIGSSNIVKSFTVMAEVGILTMYASNTGYIVEYANKRNRPLYHNTQISGVSEFYAVDDLLRLDLATYSVLGYNGEEPKIEVTSLNGNTLDFNASRTIDTTNVLTNTTYTFYYLGKEKYTGYSGGNIRIRFAGTDDIKIVMTSETGVEYTFIVHYTESPGDASAYNEINNTDPYMTHISLLAPKNYEFSTYDRITYSTNSSYTLPTITTEGYRIRYWQISYNTFTTILPLPSGQATATIDLSQYEYEFSNNVKTGKNYLLQNYTTEYSSTIFTIILQPVVAKITEIADVSGDTTIKVSTSISMSAASGMQTTKDQTGTWYSFTYNSLTDTSGSGDDGVQKLTAPDATLRGNTASMYSIQSQTKTWYKGSVAEGNKIDPDSNDQIIIKDVVDSNTYICVFDITLSKNDDGSIVELQKQQLKRIIVNPIELNFNWDNLTEDCGIKKLSSGYAIDKDYDATTGIPQSAINWLNANLDRTNIVSGDSVTVDSVYYDSELVGTGKALQYTLSGSNSDNYVITTDLTGTIEKNKISVEYAGLDENGLIYNSTDNVWEKEYDGNGIEDVYAYYVNSGVNVRLGSDKWICGDEEFDKIDADAIGKIYTLQYGIGDIDTSTSELVADPLRVRIIKKKLTIDWTLPSDLKDNGIYSGCKSYAGVYSGEDILTNIHASVSGKSATFDVYYDNKIMTNPSIVAVGTYRLQFSQIDGSAINNDYYEITDSSIYVIIGKQDITIDWTLPAAAEYNSENGVYEIDFADVDYISQIGHKVNGATFGELMISLKRGSVNIGIWEDIINCGTYTITVEYDTAEYNVTNPSIKLVVKPIELSTEQKQVKAYNDSIKLVNGKFESEYNGEAFVIDISGENEDAWLRSWWQISANTPKHYVAITIKQVITNESGTESEIEVSQVRNAGTYRLYFNGTSDNIIGGKITGKTNLIINKKSITNSFDIPNTTIQEDGVHYTYDGSNVLEMITISEEAKNIGAKITAIDTESNESVTEIKNAGTYQIKLSYDTNNYSIDNDTITLIVDRSRVELSWKTDGLTLSENKYTAMYNNIDYLDNIKVTYIKDGVSNTMQLSVSKDGVAVEAIINVGVYQVALNADYGNNYEVDGDTTIVVEITPMPIRVVGSSSQLYYGFAVLIPWYTIYDSNNEVVDSEVTSVPHFDVQYSNANFEAEVKNWRYVAGESISKSTDVVVSKRENTDYSNWDITLVNGKVTVSLMAVNITFRRDNSVTNSKSIRVYQTQQVSDPIAEFKTDGRDLSGWYNGDTLVDLDSFIPTDVDGYIFNTYTIYKVRYMDNTIVPSATIKEMTYHAKYPISIPVRIDSGLAPTKFGYTLNGWKVGETAYLYSAPTTTSQLGLAKDIDLVPNFMPTSYSLTMKVVQKGASSTTQLFTYYYTIEDYDNNKVIELQAPSIEGWWLEGVYYKDKKLASTSIKLNMLFERSEIESINSSDNTKVVIEARYQIFQRILTIIYGGKTILTESLGQNDAINWKYIDTLVEKKFGFIYTYSTNDSNSYVVVRINEFPLLYVCLGGALALAIALTIIIKTIKRKRLRQDQETLSKLLNRLDDRS